MRFLYALFWVLIISGYMYAGDKDSSLFFLKNDGSKLQKSDLAFVIPDPFVIDLIGEDGKIVKANVVLEYDNPKTRELIKAKIPLIAECIARILFSKTFDELSTQKDINNLKKEILKKVNLYIKGGKVTSVIFSEFMIQTKKMSLNSPKRDTIFVIPEPFVVNLMGQNGRRYVKASIALELSAPELQKEVTAKLFLIKDTIIRVMSSKTFEEISTPKGRDKLKEEILQDLNSYMVDGCFKGMLFTEFVIQ